jgi:hypothetical protein
MTLLVVALPQLRAQSPACSPSLAPTATLAAGIGQSDRIDRTASPAQFGGRGLDVNASLERSFGSLCVTAFGRGGHKTLTSTTGSSATERFTDGEIAITALRSLNNNPEARRSLSLGVEARAELGFTSHTYADHNMSTFRAGVASLGPALRWRQQIGGGSAVVQLATPLVGLTDHPYVPGRADPNLKFASLGSLRGANGLVSYEFSPRERLGIIASYRISSMRFDNVRPVRSLTQTFTIGIATRLGSRR